MPSVTLHQWMHACLASVLAVLPVAPPEHAHEVEEHGSRHLVIHRHAEAHHDAPGSHGHEDGTFDHADEPSLVLNAAASVPRAQLDLVPAATSPGYAAEVPAAALFLNVADVHPPIHAPPRGPTPPRAPPSLPTL